MGGVLLHGPPGRFMASTGVWGVRGAFNRELKNTPGDGCGKLLFPACDISLSGRCVLCICWYVEGTHNQHFTYSVYIFLLFKSSGNAEAEIRRAFRLARQAHPCVLFLDEIDALVTDR